MLPGRAVCNHSMTELLIQMSERCLLFIDKLVKWCWNVKNDQRLKIPRHAVVISENRITFSKRSAGQNGFVDFNKIWLVELP